MEGRDNLLGVSDVLDEVIHDFAYLAGRYAEFHPANSGDVSQVLEPEVGIAILSRFETSSSAWFDIERLDTLATIRGDGRSGYRAEGIRNKDYFESLRWIADRVVLLTRTGSDIPSLQDTIAHQSDGILLNVLHVDASARRFRIIYGNAQYGSIPSIETHIHLLADSLSIAEGRASPAMVHAHPYHLVALGRHPMVRGDWALFNAALLTGVEGINRNYDDLVGIVPYLPSGSADLVEATLPVLKRHQLLLWMNHGFVVRAGSIRRGYTLLAYAESSARAALDTLRDGYIPLPEEHTRPHLERLGLTEAFRQLRGDDSTLGHQQ